MIIFLLEPYISYKGTYDFYGRHIISTYNLVCTDPQVHNTTGTSTLPLNASFFLFRLGTSPTSGGIVKIGWRDEDNAITENRIAL